MHISTARSQVPPIWKYSWQSFESRAAGGWSGRGERRDCIFLSFKIKECSSTEEAEA